LESPIDVFQLIVNFNLLCSTVLKIFVSIVSKVYQENFAVNKKKIEENLWKMIEKNSMKLWKLFFILRFEKGPFLVLGNLWKDDKKFFFKFSLNEKKYDFKLLSWFLKRKFVNSSHSYFSAFEKKFFWLEVKKKL